MIDFIFKIIESIFKVEKEEVLILARDSVIIFFAAASVGFAVNLYHPKGYSFASTSMLQSKIFVNISGKEAKIKYDCNALFIDSRPARDFEKAHISKALNIPATPASAAFRKIKENFAELSALKEIVIYCDGTTCGSSKILAERLAEMGYSRHIYILEDGYEDWSTKQYPTETRSE